MLLVYIGRSQGSQVTRTLQPNRYTTKKTSIDVFFKQFNQRMIKRHV